MHLTISHTTRYAYDAPVHYALQRLRLTPRDSRQQQIVNWQVSITGGQREAAYFDHNGNSTELVSLTPGGTEVAITAAGEVETTDTAGIFGPQSGPVPLWLYLQRTALTEPGEGIMELAGAVRKANGKLDALHALSGAIAGKVEYGTGQTYAATAAEEALQGAKGVCQDHAHIFIAAARAAGVPARYVSGYLMMDDRTEQEAGHAWAEAHLDHLGWVGFDVSNEQCPDERYVRVACGRDYREAAPVSGLRHGAGSESMIVSLQIQQ